ncbi:unnamed protein product [Polarella glacialis]|uniref:Uncharacterized protein n=1 Tax=Polarella glacialis TaxID=89957 RepID=A0A813JWW0_POLGL|nr:unnamed protein product [Polarella glacialis]
MAFNLSGTGPTGLGPPGSGPTGFGPTGFGPTGSGPTGGMHNSTQGGTQGGTQLVTGGTQGGMEGGTQGATQSGIQYNMDAGDVFQQNSDLFGDGTDSDLRSQELNTGESSGSSKRFAAPAFKFPEGGIQMIQDRSSGNTNPRVTQQSAGDVPIDYVPPLVRCSERFVAAQFNTQTALERTASAMNITPQDMMNMPSVEQVLNIVQSHHENVTRAEMNDMAIRIDTHMMVIDRAVMATRNELQFVAQEVRVSQLELSRRQCVVGGFPTDMAPTMRNCLILHRVMARSEKLKWHLWNTSGRTKDAWATPSLLQALLATEPVTISTGYNRWGPISILTWTSFEARRAFCDEFATIRVSNTPFEKDEPFRGMEEKQLATVKLRITPSSPQNTGGLLSQQAVGAFFRQLILNGSKRFLYRTRALRLISHCDLIVSRYTKAILSARVRL